MHPLTSGNLLEIIVRKKLDEKLLEMISLADGHTDKQILEYLKIAQENKFSEEEYVLKEMIFEIGKAQILAVTSKNGKNHKEADLENYLMRTGLDAIRPGLKALKNQHAIDSGIVDILARNGREMIGVELKADKYDSKAVHAQLRAYLNDSELDSVIFVAPEIKPALFNSLKQEFESGKIEFYQLKKEGELFTFKQITEENLPEAKHKKLDFKRKKREKNSETIRVTNKIQSTLGEIKHVKPFKVNDDLVDLFDELKERKLTISLEDFNALKELSFMDSNDNIIVKSVTRSYHHLFGEDMPKLERLVGICNPENTDVTKRIAEFSKKFFDDSGKQVEELVKAHIHYVMPTVLLQNVLDIPTLKNLDPIEGGKYLEKFKNSFKLAEDKTKKLKVAYKKRRLQGTPFFGHGVDETISGFYLDLLLTYTDMHIKKAEILRKVDTQLGNLFLSYLSSPINAVMNRGYAAKDYENGLDNALYKFALLKPLEKNESDLIRAASLEVSIPKHILLGIKGMEFVFNELMSYLTVEASIDASFKPQIKSNDETDIYSAITGNRNGSTFSEDSLKRIEYFVEDMEKFGFDTEKRNLLAQEFKNFKLFKRVHSENPSDLQVRNFFDDVTLKYVSHGLVPSSDALETLYANKN